MVIADNKQMPASYVPRRSGFSLVELLAILAVVVLAAVIVVPHIIGSGDMSDRRLDAHNKAFINAAVQRWYVEKGDWPSDDLKDIGADKSYFPDGLPTSPIDNSRYALDPATHRVP